MDRRRFAMGGMIPAEFFEEFVLGNYHDFLDGEDSVRRGFNAVVPAFHMADHYFYYCQRHDPSHRIVNYGKREDTIKEKRNSYLRYLSSENEYFNDVQSIANAYKHLYQGNKNKPHVTVSSAGTIVRSPDFEMEGDGDCVIYTGKSNKKNKYRLSATLKSVIDLWEEELKDCPLLIDNN
jgi:hypothetical protein